MSDDERAIRDLVETWMAASKAGDTASRSCASGRAAGCSRATPI